MLTCDKHLHNVTSCFNTQNTTQLSKLENQFSRLETWLLKVLRIQKQEYSSLKDQHESDCQLTFGRYFKENNDKHTVAWNRVWHCSTKSCIKCTTYRLVSYLLAVTVSTLPTTMYIYLVLCMLCWFLGSLCNI